MVFEEPSNRVIPPHVPWYVAGPTATGKSAIALELAHLLDGEIISVDSMQVYRGMDIGTAKPSTDERARVPHHLIDVVGLEARFDAAQFVRLARMAEMDIQARGKTPIFSGGTGLYFKALLDGLGDGPPGDLALRAVLESQPLTELLEELREHDPATYAVIDRDNRRRVIRAIEVLRLTGKPFSAQRSDWQKAEVTEQARFFALRRAPDDLHRRIERRVDEMFERGLVEETGRLLAKGLAENPIASQALGYRQVAEHLHGDRALTETIELVKIRTRQFAKRQMTWFKRQLPVRWVDVAADSNTAELAKALSGQS